MTETTPVLLYLLFGILVVASCKGESPLLGPTPETEPETEPVPMVVKAGCPSIGDVCDQGRSIVAEACLPYDVDKNDAE